MQVVELILRGIRSGVQLATTKAVFVVLLASQLPLNRMMDGLYAAARLFVFLYWAWQELIWRRKADFSISSQAHSKAPV